MHQKTRYNIRLAEKKGVIVKKINNNKKAIDVFWKLIEKTSQRDGFTPHSKKYYAQMLELENFNLWTAEYQNNILVANIVVNFGDTITYLHGASSNKDRNVMAPHLLQWEQIKWAKERGFKIYDFWGIAKEDSQNDKWLGFTRFKKGFGGQEKRLPGTFDLVYNQKIYRVYNFFKKFV